MSSEIRAHKKKQPPSLMITSLPEDVIVDILARVSRWDYPSLSLVSKHFRSLVSSSELFARRSLLGYTEPCIYSVLYNLKTSRYHLYVLRRLQKGNSSSSSFVLIASLPPMPFDATFVSVGSKIYVLGRISRSYSFYSIDCRSHTVQRLSNIPHGPMAKQIVDVINKKIYLTRDHEDATKKVMVVFNTETQMWEPEMTTKPSKELTRFWYEYVVMADKMYVRDPENTFVYEPKEDKWELEEMLNSNKWSRGCVLDDVLYYYDPFEYKLRAYDSKHKCWKVVKGLEEFLPHTMGESPWSDTVSYGGKLAVLFIKGDSWAIRREIWCAKIAIERRQGEIWGKVKSYDVVFNGYFDFNKSLMVIV